MRRTTLGELIANAISHGLGAILSIILMFFLLLKANTTLETISSICYGSSLIILYLSSTLYHSFPDKMVRTRAVFRRLDHVGIYLLISGTYTPFLLLSNPSISVWILLIVLWVITVLGIVFKAIWVSKHMVFHVILFIMMGWSIILVWNDVYSSLTSVLPYLIAGGLAYTLGVIFFAMKFYYSHFIWHLFVLLGSLLHYIAIYSLMSLG